MRKRKTKDGDRVYRTIKRPGYGASLLKHRHGVSEIGAMHCPFTPQTIARFKQVLNQPGIDAKHSFLTRWNARRQCIETVVGEVPHDLP